MKFNTKEMSFILTKVLTELFNTFFNTFMAVQLCTVVLLRLATVFI